MTNQEITTAVVKVENIKKRTFNQEQLASLYEGGKFFTSTDNSMNIQYHVCILIIMSKC